MAKELAKIGHEVEVLCASRNEGRVAEDGVVVHRVRDWLLNASSRVTAANSERASKQPVGALTTLKAYLRKPVRSLWRALHWPDYAVGWLIPAFLMTRALIKANQYDWVITVSHPFTSHLVGLLSKPRSAGANWLVDIGDPFYLMSDPSPNNRMLYGWLSNLVERSVIAKADAISVTTKSTRAIYEEYSPAVLGKVHVISPLLSLPDFHERCSPASNDSNQPIRLVFIGSLYKNLRSPRQLLSYFEKLVESVGEKGVELHFYGAVNDCGPDFATCPQLIRPYLFLHGLVSRQEAVNAMNKADILVNIGNKSESQLASKVIEYMAVGKPILNFISIDRDTSVEALGDYPSLVVRGERLFLHEELIKKMTSFITAPPFVSVDHVAKIHDTFSPKRIASGYEQILLNKTSR